MKTSKDQGASQEWFLSERFWETFYPVMFTEEKYAEAGREAGFLLELCEDERPRVLDLACGPGRHSVPLAAFGCDVTALDASAFLLDEARRRAERAGVKLELIHGDMREFEAEGVFDLAICMWTSFGYFDDTNHDFLVLANLFEAVRPGGTVVVDVVGKEYMVRHIQPVHLTEYPDGRLLVERPALIDEMTRFSNEWLLIDGDRVDRCEFEHNLYSGQEMRDRMEAVGFRDVRLFGDLEGADYELDSERLIAVARRPESD